MSLNGKRRPNNRRPLFHNTEKIKYKLQQQQNAECHNTVKNVDDDFSISVQDLDGSISLAQGMSCKLPQDPKKKRKLDGSFLGHPVKRLVKKSKSDKISGLNQQTDSTILPDSALGDISLTDPAALVDVHCESDRMTTELDDITLKGTIGNDANKKNLLEKSEDENTLLLTDANICGDSITTSSFLNTSSGTTRLNQCITSDSSEIEEDEEETATMTRTFNLSDAMNMTTDNDQLANLNLTQISSNALNPTTIVKEYKTGTFYGLSVQVKDILKQNRRISKLYEWQHTCLCLPAVLNRKNMIYSLPTSGGKTLVAEILIMQELLLKNRNVILVLPYVSIVQEKVRDFSPFAVQLGFHIEEYAARKGVLPPKKRRAKRSVYIATIEKANAIVNSLVESKRENELGKVVVDELHMIGEGGGRGALLEILLAKIMFSFKHVQIIGMSATLGNIDELKIFLNADIFTNEFRPVELKEYVKKDDTLYLIDSTAKTEEEMYKPIRKVAHPVGFREKHKTNDPDHIVSMVLDVIPNNSCMLFCPTKKNCENVASMLSTSLPKNHLLHKEKEKQALLQNIKNVASGVCKVLSRTIPCGIAYHHSGLTMDERKLIEDAYSGGVLCLLCCTSTLAAGVNLPAKRVILRAPYVGNTFMSRAQYKQMIGRAGRAGIDTSGESILILKRKDNKKAEELLRGSLGTCMSSLYYKNGKGLRELTLSLLGLNICNSDKQLEEFVLTTLYCQQYGSQDESEDSLLVKIKKEVNCLMNLGMLTLHEKKRTDDGEDDDDEREYVNDIKVTDLGCATLKGCMDIDMAPTIARELTKSVSNGLVLANDLQLLYLATPIDQLNRLQVNWMLFYNQVGKFDKAECRAAEIIEVKEGTLIRKATGQMSSKFDDFVYKRFYLTLMLYQLTKKKSIWQVSDMFDISRGFLQNLLSSAISFTSLLVYFTAEMREFEAYKLLFQRLLDRLTNTNDMELAPLLDIPGVKLARARQLFKAGYHTLKDIAHVAAKKLCDEIEHLPYNQAYSIISSAKMILQEKIEELREEADDIEGVSTLREHLGE